MFESVNKSVRELQDRILVFIGEYYLIIEPRRDLRI